MEQNCYLWNLSIEEIVAGYKEKEESYCCVFCKKYYKKGTIYKEKDILYDAYGKIKQHVQNKHGYTVDYLLKEPAALVGISQVQQQILKLMSEGMNDKEIAHEVGIVQSTVRNHRFKLREKEKQAKLFLSLMQSLQEKTNRAINESDSGKIEELHISATMIDERYSITEKDREKTIKTYMDETGFIKQFPTKEKKKIILLREVMKNFTANREYTEKELNQILKRVFPDYSTIRRALIDYGFLERPSDCSIYRVKE